MSENNNDNQLEAFWKRTYKEVNKYVGNTAKLDYLRQLANDRNKNPNGLTVHTLTEKLQPYFFPDLHNNPEVTFWFLKYNAELYLNDVLLDNEFKRKSTSNEKVNFLQNELKSINESESIARSKEKNKSIDYSKHINKGKGFAHLFGEDYDYIEILKVLEGNFYTTYATPHSYMVIRSPEVKIFAKYILYKKHIEALLRLSRTESKSNSSGKIELQKNNPTVQVLKNVWLGEPKLSVEDLLRKGIQKGFWDENYNLLPQKGSMYGSGKTLLGNLSTALRGWAISSSIKYKIVGEAFCTFFKVPINLNVKDPYKVFSSSNPKQVKEFKRSLNIR